MTEGLEPPPEPDDFQCVSTHGKVRCELSRSHLCAHKALVYKPERWFRWTDEESWEEYDAEEERSVAGLEPPPLSEDDVERIVRRFHEVYESWAPSFGWATQEDTQVPWDGLPAANRNLMLTVIREVMHAELASLTMHAELASLTAQVEKLQREVERQFQEIRHLEAAEYKSRTASEAAEGERDELQQRDQRWVDQVCHYRNLSIMLGAKPEQMLTGHDRQLAAKWGEPSMHDGDWTMDDELAEVAECWEKLEAAEAENAKLRDVVEELRKLHRPETVGMYEWKCFNGDDCGHDDECPLTDVEVCGMCWNLWTQDGRDDEAPIDDEIRWPCPTVAALDRLGDKS